MLNQANGVPLPVLILLILLAVFSYAVIWGVMKYLNARGDAEQTVAAPAQPQWLSRDTVWILAVPADHFRVTYVVPLPQTRLGTQVADFDTNGLTVDNLSSPGVVTAEGGISGGTF
mgnify:CR=1 FL=1